MPAHITVTSEPLADPRGSFRGQPAPLAERLSSLKGKHILLLDNGQLTAELAAYGPVFEWLSRQLQDECGAHAVCDRRNLLDGGKQSLGVLADEIAASPVNAVVVALCHAGVTQPSCLFAAELERRGIVCVLLCTELGLPLAAATAAAYVPGLPLVLARAAAGAKDAFGLQETAAIAPEIIAGLTSATVDLVARFGKRFPPDRPNLIGENGDMRLNNPITAPTTNRNGHTCVEIDPGKFAEDLYSQLCAADMCDGFPVIPPTKERVRAMLGFTDLEASHVLIDECPPSGASVTVQSLAVNAVMAGCRAEYFPILIAAFQAMADPDYRLFQGAITTHPAGNAVLVSGPLAGELGIHSGAGCLGPGFRANATIGRAITLTILNVARAIPGRSDLTVFGSPAEFTYCFAESALSNPWSPLHAELYGLDVTSVTVHKCEGPHNVIAPHTPGPEALLKTIASTAATQGGNNATYLGQLLILLNPGQAKMIADAGWSKNDVKAYLFETARHPLEFAIQQKARAIYPPYFLGLSHVPVMRSPEDVIVVVCGGPGPHAMVGVPWGLAKAVSRAVTLKDGRALRSLASRGRM
jgi:hypothetical protein